MSHATESRDLGLLDRALVVLGILLVSAASTILFTGYPLRSLLFPGVFRVSGEPVATLTTGAAGVRRKTMAGPEFSPIQEKAVIFNHDTLVTGPGGAGTFVFSDGTEVTLEERTMVVVERDSSLGGVRDGLVVGLIQGRVATKSKSIRVQIRNAEKLTLVTPGGEATVSERFVTPAVTPVALASPQVQLAATPIPVVKRTTPVRVDFLSPGSGTTLRIPAFSPTLEAKTLVSWRLSEGSPVRLSVVTQGREVLSRDFPGEKNAGQAEIRLTTPGTYEAKLVDPETGRTLGARRFELSPVVEGLTLEAPLVAGKKMASNAFMGSLQKDFKVEFKWRGPAEVTQYRLDLFHSLQDKKAGLSFPVKGSAFSLKRSQAINGTFYYQVSAQKGAFTLASRREPFRFDFLPPLPTVPSDDAHLKSTPGGTEVLFTWQKTNFTERYRYELSRTPDFASILFKRELKENFLVIRRMTPGSYYWRVQSLAGKVASVPSQTSRVTLLNP